MKRKASLEEIINFLYLHVGKELTCRRSSGITPIDRKR